MHSKDLKFTLIVGVAVGLAGAILMLWMHAGRMEVSPEESSARHELQSLKAAAADLRQKSATLKEQRAEGKK